ncbi:MAG: GNAT family N-acetyltransferase [Acidimicrobiales bacterium]
MGTNDETGTSGEVPGADVPDAEVVDNPALHRYELRHDGSVVGVVQYRIDGDVMTIPHVEVAGQLRGKGVSGPFLDEVLARIEARGLKVVPTCGYAASHIAARPDLRHLVA